MIRKIGRMMCCGMKSCSPERRKKKKYLRCEYTNAEIRKNEAVYSMSASSSLGAAAALFDLARLLDRVGFVSSFSSSPMGAELDSTGSLILATTSFKKSNCSTVSIVFFLFLKSVQSLQSFFLLEIKGTYK